MSNFSRGISLLIGDNTIPGIDIPDELKVHVNTIFNRCREFGLDFYPTIVQFLTYDQISEIAAYGGFAVRYPNWRFGMEFEELSNGYELGLQRIYEMVINTNPCILYCLSSNSLVDNVTVIAHALGHNHFFKNNIYFRNTDTAMFGKMANHGVRIRKYIKTWGKERVSDFIDSVLRIDTLIDSSVAGQPKQKKELQLFDERKTYDVHRRHIDEGHEYMHNWINSKEFLENQRKENKLQEVKDELGIYERPNRDILGYLRDYAPLKPWQQDIIAMLHEEALYYDPQRKTKVINEGFASWVDSNLIAGGLMASLGQSNDSDGIIEYAIHKAGVLGGKYSRNPYKLGFTLLRYIEDRWNKGRFGQEYYDCKDINKKENWDLKLGLGKDKVFEVCKYYNDYQLIDEFFTDEFCHENEFYIWQKYPDGTYRIANRDPKIIKKTLLETYGNGGLPDIRLTDPNHKNKGIMVLQHYYDGRDLFESYIKPTMESVSSIWGNTVVLITGPEENEVVYVCNNHLTDQSFSKMTREQYETSL